MLVVLLKAGTGGCGWGNSLEKRKKLVLSRGPLAGGGGGGGRCAPPLGAPYHPQHILDFHPWGLALVLVRSPGLALVPRAFHCGY